MKIFIHARKNDGAWGAVNELPTATVEIASTASLAELRTTINKLCPVSTTSLWPLTCIQDTVRRLILSVKRGLCAITPTLQSQPRCGFSASRNADFVRDSVVLTV